MRIIPWWRLTAVPMLAMSLLVGVSVAAPAATATHPDVRVLIDISGSMKQNDPHNLRKPALDLLVRLFPKEAKAGVWTFGENVAVLVPDKNVSEGWRAIARSKAVQITSDSLYTNIPAALERAAENIDNTYRTSFILLTDGMVDISKSEAENRAARQHLLNDILPRLRSAGVVVHSIALSKSADRELMERLAADTGGLFAVAETADQLKQVFLQAFDAAAPAEQVPLAGNHFLVDSSIEELTALVLHKESKPVELVSPDNKHHSFANHGDDFKWFQGDGFDLITVTKPYEGEWTAVAELEKGSRITIVSNLSLAASRFSESLFVDSVPAEITAALKQQGEAIKDPIFLKLVKFGATIQRREDGKQWTLDLSADNPTPADGYFHGAMNMLGEPGTYDLAINADGKTFQRSQKQTVAVRENFDVRVAATDSIPPAHSVTLFAQNPAIDSGASAVTAHIKSSDGKTVDQAIAVADREWTLTLDSAEQSGRIEVYFDIAGQNTNGEKFNYRSATVAIGQSGNQIIAPPQKQAAAAETAHEEPKPAAAPAPAHAETKKAEPAPAIAPADNKKDWHKWVLYGGLVLGNLLILGLGFFAYRVIMGGGKSKVLEETDDDNDDDIDAVKGGKDSKDRKK
ncbi:MAG TPA: vWA domain-containing protein, partial [Spongiibacteraceae bacterium]